MLVLDLDGTALRHDGELDPLDVAAAHALHAAGVHVTIATGRLFSGTRRHAKSLGVRGSVAVMNGSEIIDVQTETAGFGQYLPAPVQDHVRDVFAAHDVMTLLYHSRRIHYPQSAAKLKAYLGTWSEDLRIHDDVHAAEDWRSDRIVAICAVGTEPAVHAARDALELPAELGTEVFYTFYGERFVKVRSAVEDKGTAIARLAAERGLTPADVVVVGDWLNDVSMFRAAGRSFAMRGSEVEQAAGEVLESERGAGGAVAEVARRVWGL
jgi:hypothetical protein